jgi:hypothetical protein
VDGATKAFAIDVVMAYPVAEEIAVLNNPEPPPAAMLDRREPSPKKKPVDVTFAKDTLLAVPSCKAVWAPETSVAPVPPLAIGKAPVTLVVRLTNVVAFVPVPPLAIGRVPDTPDASGRSVAFKRLTADGVPKFGVTRTGFVDNTILPVPVSSVMIEASCADVVAANWLRLPSLISFTAKTILLFAVVVRAERTPILELTTSPNVLRFEKLLSTSRFVKGVPFTVLKISEAAIFYLVLSRLNPLLLFIDIYI